MTTDLKKDIVYVVQHVINYEGSWIEGVYDNMEDAFAAIKKEKVDEYSYYTIKEYKLNTRSIFINKYIYDNKNMIDLKTTH